MYSPNWNKLYWPIVSILHSPYYYCPREGKVYQTVMVEKTRSDIEGIYTDQSRYDRIVEQWKLYTARENLSLEKAKEIWLLD